MTTTYAEHAEAAAGSLALLLRTPIPNHADHDVILALRQAAVDAVNDRLSYLANLAPRPKFAGSYKLPLGELAQHPVDGLRRVAQDSATLRPDLSPTDVLGVAHSNTHYAAWSRASTNLLLANHCLATAQDQPWLSTHADAWPLVSDTAAVTEALALLDDRIPWVKASPEHEQRRYTIDETRVITGLCIRQAGWSSQSRVPDLAYSRAMADSAAPARTVTVAADLAAAQRHLAKAIEPRRSVVLGGPDERHLDARIALHFTRGQHNVLTHLDAHLARSAAYAELREEVRGSMVSLGRLNAEMGRIYNVSPDVRPNAHVLHQLQEISTSLRRVDLATLERRQTADLVAATQTALASYGRAVRYEAYRHDSILRLVSFNANDEPTMLRIGHKRPVVRYARELASLAPETAAPFPLLTDPTQRRHLQDTLANTRTRPLASTPFPSRGETGRG